MKIWKISLRKSKVQGLRSIGSKEEMERMFEESFVFFGSKWKMIYLRSHLAI